MVTSFNDSERIQANYCKQSIRHMLIYRFSMNELRRIAREQGMLYKRHTAKYDRHINEFIWFEDRIYKSLSESVRKSIVKYELRLFMPYDSINITEEDRRNWDEFEHTIYQVVK